MSVKRIIFILCLILVSFFSWILFQNKTGLLNTIIPLTHSGESLQKKDLFQEAYAIIEKNYFGFQSVSKDTLTAGMIKGVVDSLGDKHSEYFNIEETKSFNEVLAGDFEGIGAVVDKNELGVQVKQVLAGSPAKEGGILQGDILIKANNESLEGLSLTDAIKKIRGKAGTIVHLDILRAGEKGIITKDITRNKIDVPSVDSKMLENKTGYIILTMFGEKTEEEFLKAYIDLKNQGATSFIIDLRDNGGGYLETAVSILSQFIEKGKILVTTKENDPFKNDSYFSQGTTNTKYPIIVLVNENSASASEITSGALKDYGLALLVGKKTYGKGSVQQPFKLSDGSELKITVAKWYTPLDHMIDKIGIDPDIEITLLKEDYEKWYDRQLEEAKKIMETYKKEGREKTIEIYKKEKEAEALKAQTNSWATASGKTLPVNK